MKKAGFVLYNLFTSFSSVQQPTWAEVVTSSSPLLFALQARTPVLGSMYSEVWTCQVRTSNSASPKFAYLVLRNGRSHTTAINQQSGWPINEPGLCLQWSGSWLYIIYYIYIYIYIYVTACAIVGNTPLPLWWMNNAFMSSSTFSPTNPLTL